MILAWSADALATHLALHRSSAATCCSLRRLLTTTTLRSRAWTLSRSSRSARLFVSSALDRTHTQPVHIAFCFGSKIVLRIETKSLSLLFTAPSVATSSVSLFFCLAQFACGRALRPGLYIGFSADREPTPLRISFLALEHAYSCSGSLDCPKRVCTIVKESLSERLCALAFGIRKADAAFTTDTHAPGKVRALLGRTDQDCTGEEVHDGGD